MMLFNKVFQPLPFHFKHHHYFPRFLSNASASKPLKIFPTGSFVDLRQNGGYYLDKTHFISELENLNSPAILSLRPHCFGKSLFLSTLSSYYDINNKGENFERLFGDLYIGKNPTPLASSLRVLNLNFSEFYNNLKQFYSSLKYACNNGLVRVFQTGVIPIGTADLNNVINLTQKIKFWDLYGFKESEIEFLLNNTLEYDLSTDVKEGIMKWLKKEAYGYFFHRYQIEGIFNPAWVLYYFKKIMEQMKFIDEAFYNNQDTSVIIKALLDFPSDSHSLLSIEASDLIVDDPLGKSIFMEASNQLESEDITQQFDHTNIDKLTTDRNSLLSFMYYNGVLTYQPNSLQYKFQIPNNDVKKKFIENALENYDWKEKDLMSITKCLQILEGKYDIEPLCQFVEKTLHKLLKNNDPNEEDLIQAFIDTLIFTFYADIKPEFWVNYNVDEKIIDLVRMSTGKRIAIECDNIKMECIKLNEIQDNTEETTKISSSLLEKSEDEILKLEINDPNQPSLKTVGELLEWKIKKQSKKYLELLEKQEDESLRCSFIVLRIGLHRLISRKVYCDDLKENLVTK
ncbi:14506_t:CDS:2 [Rhizophagus irregularis]|nr:14506_t:CDS:2 [Rhizophagus irregularis]